ncbi:MAG: hypothetical protein AB7V50_05110 [Vampirovibrionia bacterium]
MINLKTKAILTALLITLLIPGTTFANNGYGNQPLQGSISEVPAGRTVEVKLETGLSTEVNRVGDNVVTRLNRNFYDNGMLILPAGTTINGQITELTQSGRTGKNGTMRVNFTNAILPDGKRVPLTARIETEDGSGIIKGGSTKGRVGKMLLRGVEGAAAGAILGTAMGGISKGKVGRGAAYGTAIGGGVGMASNVVAKGKPAEIQSGSRLELIFERPFKL